MDKMIVRYNGGTGCIGISSSPTKLVVGQKYEVEKIEVGFSWTIYRLKGIEGRFNVLWFDEVEKVEKSFMAFAYRIPREGEKCKFFKLGFVKGQPELIGSTTVTVKEVSNIDDNIYYVTTSSRKYVVKVVEC